MRFMGCKMHDSRTVFKCAMKVYFNKQKKKKYHNSNFSYHDSPLREIMEINIFYLFQWKKEKWMQEYNNKPLKIKELNVYNNYNDLTN